MSNQLESAMRHYEVPRPQLGIILCLLSMLIFASQDGITKVLVKDLPIAQLVMVRYWVFLAFAVGYSVYQGSLRTACRSQHPFLQVIRALIGVGEIALFGIGLRYLGLAEMHALYAVFPLMTLALAGAFLGEYVGVRRWIAAAVGFLGTVVILRPGTGVFELAALIPLLSALGFAVFSVLTRRISQGDSFATNMLYMGFFGAIAITLLGLAGWVSPSPEQWALIGVLSITGVVAQLLLIQALRYATAATLQPFNYTLLVFATLIGLFVFGELPDAWTVVGACMVIAGGLYAIKVKG
ncbi:DMT family transporter [Pseudomonas bijieensis]|uniref:DMT family transporter n=1 Tax=Pseudomonas bijieensis TaxID=2681983 RepID=A0A6N1CLL8_9PSED|nr:DMT family transporter [Pseudomonas bijieensis]MCD9113635.1 DMT family transporter [Pseudomonas bijieensis]QKS85698.1 DMT family transporter [Pseudomonas bijieensis]